MGDANDGKQTNFNGLGKVGLRIIELLIAPAVVGLIVLYGSNATIGAEVKNLKETVGIISVKLEKVYDNVQKHLTEEELREEFRSRQLTQQDRTLTEIRRDQKRREALEK